MSSPRGNALIGQSGGPTCVINQSLVGVIEEAQAAGPIGDIYGALHGIQGVLDENLIDLGRESSETLEALARTPCAGLRSVRKKPTREECERVLKTFKKYDIRFFFYIGGNDSAETAYILNEIAVAADYDVRLFHVPKTIDNDLCVTDHCPGYGSAAKFVASAFMGDNQDNRSLPGIKIDIVMGRHAGWLTASSLLARQHEDDGPHLIYVPLPSGESATLSTWVSNPVSSDLTVPSGRVRISTTPCRFVEARDLPSNATATAPAGSLSKYRVTSLPVSVLFLYIK